MSERLRSIVEQLDIHPDDRVLEIGCGHGVAAAYICARLGKGQLTAVDRSAKMINMAKRRNEGYMAEGKVRFILSTLEGLDLGDLKFDKIFAVRVGIFHRDPGRARSIVQKWLSPAGTISTFFDPPSEGNKNLVK